MSRISNNFGNKLSVLYFWLEFNENRKRQVSTIIVEGVLERCIVSLAELPDVVHITYVLQMHLFVPVCLILKHLTLCSVTAAD